MLRYLTIGSNDIARAGRFYDPVLGVLGIPRFKTLDHEIAYSTGDAGYTIWIVTPFDGRPASFGNGSMLAFNAPSRAAVDAFYRAALESGGQDEGKPGLRPYGENFYACYVRDPDGNKLSAVYAKPE